VLVLIIADHFLNALLWWSYKYN